MKKLKQLGLFLLKAILFLSPTNAIIILGYMITDAIYNQQFQIRFLYTMILSFALYICMVRVDHKLNENAK